MRTTSLQKVMGVIYVIYPEPARWGFRGYIVPRPGLGGPGVRGPERVQVSALSFGVAPCGVCMGLNFSEDLFYFFLSFN